MNRKTIHSAISLVLLFSAMFDSQALANNPPAPGFQMATPSPAPASPPEPRAGGRGEHPASRRTVVELRDGDEIKNLWYEKPMALPEVKCFNPSFDVTDHELLTGIVTEKGICYPPFNESLAALFKDKK